MRPLRFSNDVRPTLKLCSRKFIRPSSGLQITNQYETLRVSKMSRPLLITIFRAVPIVGIVGTGSLGKYCTAQSIADDLRCSSKVQFVSEGGYFEKEVDVHLRSRSSNEHERRAWPPTKRGEDSENEWTDGIRERTGNGGREAVAA